MRNEITFQHHEDITPPDKRQGLLQVAYHFEPGRTYLVFASKTETSGLYTQMGGGYGFKTDYGMLRCANDQPVTAQTIQEIVWNELAAMLHGKDAGDVEYAMAATRSLSGGIDYPFPADYRHGIDFQRQDVAELVRGLVHDPDAATARNAIAFIGSHNPYMDERRAAELDGESETRHRARFGPAGENARTSVAVLPCAKMPCIRGRWQSGWSHARPVCALALSRVREPTVGETSRKMARRPRMPLSRASMQRSCSLIIPIWPPVSGSPKWPPIPIAALPQPSPARLDLASVRNTPMSWPGCFKHPDSKVRRHAAMSLLSLLARYSRRRRLPGRQIWMTRCATADWLQTRWRLIILKNTWIRLVPGSQKEKMKAAVGRTGGGDMIPPCDTARIWTLFNYIKSQSAEDHRSGKVRCVA